MAPKPQSPQGELFASNIDSAVPFSTKISVSNAVPKTTLKCTRCDETFLSDYQVAKRYVISRSAIWRWVNNDPKFPRPIKLSRGTTRWKLSDLVKFEVETERPGTTWPNTNSVAD